MILGKILNEELWNKMEQGKYLLFQKEYLIKVVAEFHGFYSSIYYNLQIMKKEDYQSHNNGSPIDLIFIPEALEVQFQDKVKLQIAFYRNNKVCKTKPVKFNKSDQHQNRISLQRQKLPFCTTINLNPFNKTFESKIISVQLAIQTDGQKQALDGKIDLKDVLSYQSTFQKSGLVIQFKNGIKLFYGVNGKITNIKGQQQHNSKSKSPLKNMNDKSQQIKKQELKLDHVIEKKQKKVGDQKQNIEKQNQNVGRKVNFIQQSRNIKPQKQNRQKQLQQDLQASKTKVKLLEDKIGEAYKKVQNIQEQNLKLKNRIKQLQSSNQIKQREITETEKFINKLTEQRNNLLKNASKNNQEEQILNKKNHQIDKLNHQIHALKETNNQLMNRLQQMRRSQLEIRNKYQQSERKNVTLVSEISEAHYKCQKIERENEKCQKRIEKLEEQLNADSIIQHKKVVVDDSKQKDQQIVRLTKLVETKEQMIKMLKKESQSKKKQLQQDLKLLQKQNKQLKEEIEKQKNNKKDQNNLQLKLLYEKAKKECTQAKRQQKKMLNERADIQTKNKQLHQQIMILKERIGKILNIVQELGSPDLFTQVVDCVS